MSTPRPAWAAGHSSLVVEMKEGKLKTRADVERVVRRLLDARQNGWVTTHNRTYLSTPNPRILQFFREFFCYYKADEVFKDVDKFTKHDGFKQFVQGSASKLAYDTDSLIRNNGAVGVNDNCFLTSSTVCPTNRSISSGCFEAWETEDIGAVCVCTVSRQVT